MALEGGLTVKCSMRVAMAVGAGDVLGRRHKLAAATLMAAAAAAGGTSVGGTAIRKGAKLVVNSGVLDKMPSQVGEIVDAVRGDLLDAGKAAASATITAKIDSLADSLHDRAERLRNPGEAVAEGAEATRDKARDTGEAAGAATGKARDAGEGAAAAARGAASGATRRARGRGADGEPPDDDREDSAPRDEADEAEEDVGDEYEADEYADADDSYADEDEADDEERRGRGAPGPARAQAAHDRPPPSGRHPDEEVTGMADAAKDKHKGPIDRLKAEAGGMLSALGERAMSSVRDKVEDVTSRLAGIAEGDHGPGLAAAATGARSMAEGKGPMRSMLSAGFSGVKEKVSGMFGGKGGKSKGGKKLKFNNIVETIDVGVPLRLAYDQWNQFTEFPTFMKKVENAERTEEGNKLNWKAQVFWSHRTWESTVIDQHPDERIIWRSKGQKGHVDGAVTFHELAPSLTRIVLILEYHPQGFMERTGNIWRAQGRRARLELKHFARHVMTNTILKADEIEGWRGVIEDGEVVLSHEDAMAKEQQESAEEPSAARRARPRRARPEEGEAPDSEAPDSEAPDSEAREGEGPEGKEKGRRAPEGETNGRRKQADEAEAEDGHGGEDGHRGARRARRRAQALSPDGEASADEARAEAPEPEAAEDGDREARPGRRRGGARPRGAGACAPPAGRRREATAPRAGRGTRKEQLMSIQTGGGGVAQRPQSSGLADVIDTILDKGLVIDAYVRVSLVGIELLTIDARVVVASVDTYLRFAEAVNRLDISQDKESLPELVGDMEQGGAKKKTKGALEGAGDKIREFASDGRDEREREHASRRSR